MPNIIIEGPVIKDIEAKRILVREITDVVERVYKLPRQAFVVTIKETSPENVGVGGELVVDRFKR